MAEPDYTPVQGHDGDNPEEQVGFFPSSFMKDSKSVRRLCGTSLRSYRMRRRLTGLGVLGIFFIAAGIATIEFGKLHGHIDGGAGSFLGPSDSKNMMLNMGKKLRQLKISSWNIAAINNNPFEYWITINDNPGYEKLMLDVEHYLEEPGPNDVPVSSVFTDAMYNTLEQKMFEVGWDSGHKVRRYWEEDFRNRKIITEFLKDPLLGSKRLASMPDRVTNTINIVGTSEPACRPTVINMYEEDLSTLDQWWDAWMKFMFRTPLPIKTSNGVESIVPYTMLKSISRSKYPDVTEEEEELSLPLQTMCGAIFDAILVHMMNTVSQPEVWQPLKHTMVEALNRKKVQNTLRIIREAYGDTDIFMLQEVSSSFIDDARRSFGSQFYVVAPEKIDATRDQNSIILLNKKKFPGPTTEITEQVLAAFPVGQKLPVAMGDILAITSSDADNVPYVLASFHGDTNGLATIPTLTALKTAISSDRALSKHRLLFGLDANTYEKGIPNKKQDVLEFGQVYTSYGLSSCWGDVPDPKNYTTYNARTFLQPQLNKACKSSEKQLYGDINPKDFILFPKHMFNVIKTYKDNTGRKKYIEQMAFPTLDFPSDHGILSTVVDVIP